VIDLKMRATVLRSSRPILLESPARPM